MKIAGVNGRLQIWNKAETAVDAKFGIGMRLVI